jgi:hypothetical protein
MFSLNAPAAMREQWNRLAKRTRTQIEDLPAIGESLSEERLRLVCGGRIVAWSITGATGTMTCTACDGDQL